MSLSLPGGWSEGPHRRLRLHIKDIREVEGKKRYLDVKSWGCVKDVKAQLVPHVQVPVDRQRLYYKGRELKNGRTLQECGIYRDGCSVVFTVRPAITGKGRPMIECSGGHRCPRELLKTFYQVQRGLDLGFAPVLAMEGQGGTYFMKDTCKQYAACLKPQDEEPFADCNPRGLVGQMGNGQTGLREGILAGEACEREVAAYILDKDRFAGVPATTLVECYHPVLNYIGSNKTKPKFGSLQEFVNHQDVMSNLSPSMFDPQELHKIAIIDIRLINTDRHDANILITKRRKADGERYLQTIPIDHGYILPDRIEVAWCDWCWYSWPQIKMPLSEKAKRFIASLDPEEDVKRLRRKLTIREICLRNFLVSNMLLKKGAAAGLSLYEIASIMCREDLDLPSMLEVAMVRTKELTWSQLVSSSGIESSRVGVLAKSPEPLDLRDDSERRISALDPELQRAIDLRDSLKVDKKRSSNGKGGRALDLGLPSPLSRNGSGEKLESSPIPPSSPPGFWASQPPMSRWDSTSSQLLHSAADRINSASSGNSMASHSLSFTPPASSPSRWHRASAVSKALWTTQKQESSASSSGLSEDLLGAEEDLDGSSLSPSLQANREKRSSSSSSTEGEKIKAIKKAASAQNIEVSKVGGERGRSYSLSTTQDLPKAQNGPSVSATFTSMIPSLWTIPSRPGSPGNSNGSADNTSGSKEFSLSERELMPDFQKLYFRILGKFIDDLIQSVIDKRETPETARS